MPSSGEECNCDEGNYGVVLRNPKDHQKLKVVDKLNHGYTLMTLNFQMADLQM